MVGKLASFATSGTYVVVVQDLKMGTNYRIPESVKALCRMVSLTAANTRRMFEVSVACVRLY